GTTAAPATGSGKGADAELGMGGATDDGVGISSGIGPDPALGIGIGTGAETVLISASFVGSENAAVAAGVIAWAWATLVFAGEDGAGEVVGAGCSVALLGVAAGIAAPEAAGPGF